MLVQHRGDDEDAESHSTGEGKIQWQVIPKEAD
jgi:hypothetical protein